MNSVVKTEFVPQPTDQKTKTLATNIPDPVLICGGFGGAAASLFASPSVPSRPGIKSRWRKAISHSFMKNPYDDQRGRKVPQPTFLGLEAIRDINAMSFRGGVCHHSVRFLPPEFPPKFINGNHSGFCRVSFAYGKNGLAQDLSVISCTDEILARPSLKAVRKWRRTGNGCAVASEWDQRETTKIRFDLRDEDGKVLPLPIGY